MYWTDWGTMPGRIERAGMDGSNRQVIVNTGLKWPNGLTLDLVHQRIFWVDAKMNSISSSNYDGSERRLVLQSPEAVNHPFSITTFEDYVYWTDWANETIFKANKFTGKELTPILPPKSVSFSSDLIRPLLLNDPLCNLLTYLFKFALKIRETYTERLGCIMASLLLHSSFLPSNFVSFVWKN